MEVHGIPSMVIRTGNETGQADFYVLDIRGQEEVGRDKHGPVRQIGTSKDGSMGAVGDFILVRKSDDGESLDIRALYPGSRWEVGPGSPWEVAGDQCAVGIDEEGGLVVENLNPEGETTVFRPETVETSPETPTEISESEAVDLLSYTDVLDGFEATSAVAHTEESPSGRKYTKKLMEMAKEVGKEKLIATATTLKQACLDELKRLDIEPSEFASSVSWALWGLAKQRYLSENPQESSPDYKLGDPLAEDDTAGEILNGIVDRHVGWEYDRAHHVKTGQRNQTGQLRSKDLAALGARLRGSHKT